MKHIYSEYILPDGKKIIIRNGKIEDAPALIKLKKSYIKDTTSIPLYEDEYKNGILEETAWINRFGNEENSLLLVAEYNSNLIGNIDLNGNQRRKLYHTAMIGMGIAYDWHNKKIGSLLMECTIKWALTSNVKIIWLEVYSTNTGGIKLYEKFGFEECGIIKNFFEKENPADKITMVKYL